MRNAIETFPQFIFRARHGRKIAENIRLLKFSVISHISRVKSIIILALFCGLVPFAGAAELYHTNRVFNKVTFTIPGVPTAFEVFNMAGQLTTVVGPTNVITNSFYATERQSVVLSYTASAQAWAAAVAGYPSNSMVHPNKYYDNAGWVKGLLQTRDGNWGGYIWAMQNTVNFKTSATNVWVSTDGVTNSISKVLVGTIGDYAPMQTVEDTGPTLEGLINNPLTSGSSNDVVYTANFTAYYDINLPSLWIEPLLTNVCINSGNVNFTLSSESRVANGVTWSLTPEGLTNGATWTGYASNAVVNVGGIATSYVVKATANNNTNIFGSAVLNVVKVGSPLQYKIGTNLWANMPDPLYVCKDTSVDFKAIKSPMNASWPSGKPVWGGVTNGVGETKSVTFTSLGSNFITAECGNTVTGNIFVLKVGMTAYRPTTELSAYGHPFAKHEVPDNQEENPGAGIRVNGDDDNLNSTADRTDTTVTGENDLIEVILDAAPPAPSSGFKYVMKRSSSNIKVWNSQTKGTAWLDANDETNLTFSTTPMTVWVENLNGNAADLELQAKTDSGTVVCSDKVHFYPFSSVVVLFEGEFGIPSDPPESGISTLALAAYMNGYDVHVYDEPDTGETPNTEDAAFSEIDSAVEERGVTAVAVIGYSHGGGSTYRISDLMDADATVFNLAFTAYIDAIEQPFFKITAEERRPVGSAFHVNYYQVAQMNDAVFFLDGAPSIPAGAGFEDNVDHPTVTESHKTIDDAQVVQDGIRTRLFQQVNR